VRHGVDGAWEWIASAPRCVTVVKYDNDQLGDIVGSWVGLGLYVRDSVTGNWTRLASAADNITSGDIDDDGRDDLIGSWFGEMWVRYGGSGIWQRLTTSPSVADLGHDP
jgi:hypothetical protein